MKRRVVSILVACLVALGALIWVGSPAAAVHWAGSASFSNQIRMRRVERQRGPVLIGLGRSRPLREAVPALATLSRRRLPPRYTPYVLSLGEDPVVQVSAGPPLSVTPSLNFEGLGEGAYSYSVAEAPPDANGAAGATQYVQWVNLALTVYDKKTGTLESGPTPGNTLFEAFNLAGGSNCGRTNDGEPVVKYDAAARRWILAQVSFSLANPAANIPYEECIAVSTTSNAAGSYNLYALQWPDSLPDSFKLGVWSDAYYTSANLFLDALSFTGAEVCALDRGTLLDGRAPTPVSGQCFQLGSFASLLPADLDGATTPPPNTPGMFMNLGQNSLNLWKFHVDFETPSKTHLSGPDNIRVAPFYNACGSGACIPQGGSAQLLDSRADRVMYRLAYRNFGTHQALLLNHSVTPTTRQKRVILPIGISAIRWYELRDPNGNAHVFQQGTYAPDSNSRWMGSIASDKAGNIVVGYSVSSDTMNPAIRTTGRVPTDPHNMLAGEISIFEGSGSQLPSLSRWGDYTSMSVDPVDDCTFYYTNEYLLTDGTFNWNTRIASFKLPGCD